MSIIYAESRFNDARADALVLDNRKAHDAVCEVPHTLDPVDRMVLIWCAALSMVTTAILIAERVLR